jgi:hypothetical protein
MAWIRTLIVLAGSWALIALHVLADEGWSIVAVAYACVAVSLLITCGHLGARRTRQARAAMDASSTPVRPLALAMVACAASLAGCAALVAAVHMTQS